MNSDSKTRNYETLSAQCVDDIPYKPYCTQLPHLCSRMTDPSSWSSQRDLKSISCTAFVSFSYDKTKYTVANTSIGTCSILCIASTNMMFLFDNKLATNQYSKK